MQSSSAPQPSFPPAKSQRRKENADFCDYFASLRLCGRYSAELSEQLRMDRGYRLRINFGLAIVRKQSIDLLLDVRQLRVTKARQKLERRDSLHQIAILLQQLSLIHISEPTR